MAIDTHRHIGPYLRVKVQTRDTFRVVDSMCCGVRRAPGYCPKCGKSTGEQEACKEELVNVYEIGQSIDERLRPLRDCCGQIQSDFHCWMENGPGTIDPDKPGDRHRYTAKTGKRAGDDGWIVPAMDEMKAEQELKKAAELQRYKIRGLSYWDWERVSAEKILAVAAILWPEVKT